MKKFGTSILVLCVLASSALADNNVAAKTELAKAQGLWKNRVNLKKTDEAIKILEASVELSDVEARVKFDSLVLLARLMYWKGRNLNKGKAKLHKAAYKQARKALKLEGFDKYAEAQYWYALNFAQWGKAALPISLPKLPDLLNATQKVKEMKTVDGKAGELYAGYGADRLLGGTYNKLLKSQGGDHAKALKYGGIAFEKAPDHSRNIVVFAEILFKGNKAQQTEACLILKKFVAQDPKEFGKKYDRIPETMMDKKEASEMLVSNKSTCWK